MINPELKSEVEILLDEVDRTHRYSMSRIYSLWNIVNEKDETPQSCASCLIRKVKDLRSWLEKVSGNDAPVVVPSAEKKVKRTCKKAVND
ncbi:hypothetical protein FACS1894179_04990 [Bacteroidia bacterium]|nr:hypothetical protein FACS1894179_04990 [Bacteroidia bacterium]